MKSGPARDSTAIAPGGSPPGAMAFPEGADESADASRGTSAASRAATVSDPAVPHGVRDPRTGEAPCAPVSAARRRFSALLVLATLLLIFAGAEVKSRGAGLSVPDWPLSYGMVWPPMVGNIFYEHGHRFIATCVGALVTLMAVWTARTERRRWVRTLAWCALGAVIAQGVLGGLTVLFLLPPAISISHGILAQTLLCLLTWLAFATSREWSAQRTADGARAPERAPGGGSRRAVVAAACATGAVFVQLILGAVMRHNEAGLAVPFFPTSPTGAWIPDVVDLRVVLHLLHRGFAVVVLLLVLFAARRIATTHAHLARHAFALAVLVCGQVLLGATIIWTAQRDPASDAWVRMPVPASVHVLLGATLLAGTWLMCLRCWRAEHVPAARADGAADVVPAGAMKAAGSSGGAAGAPAGAMSSTRAFASTRGER